MSSNRHLGRHPILEKIGEGGMGAVYRAEDTRLRRTVALKFLLPDLTRDPAARERFVHEARAAAALDHPNICTIHEIDEAEGQVFIAMAFVEGRTLKRRIEEGPMPLDEVTRIGTQVIEGLKAAGARSSCARCADVPGEGPVKAVRARRRSAGRTDPPGPSPGSCRRTAAPRSCRRACHDRAAGRQLGRPLNPGDPLTHADYAWFCAFMGRFDEAVSEIRHALELDPLVPLFAAFAVGVLVEARRFDEAVTAYHRAIELDPQSGLAYFHGGCALYGVGMLEEARAAFERSLELADFSGWADWMLGRVLADQGRREDAEHMLQSMIDKRKRRYFSPVCIACLCWRLGRADDTFAYFDKGFDERDSLMPVTNVFPFIDDLRREPRFQAILDRLRFPSRT